MLIFFYNCKENKSSNVISENIVPKSTEYFLYSNKTNNLISAHRGGSGLKNYPENCLETMEYLYQKGVSVFEIDIAKTADSKLILMHDNSLQRTSTGRQDVDQINLQKIKEYYLVDDFGNETNYKIPTFEETLKWGKNKNLYFMVDIKKDVNYENLIELIRNNNMQNQCVLVSYSLAQAEKLHRLAPEMMLSVSMRNEREFNEMIDSEIPTNRMVAFTGTKLSDKSLFNKIHQEDIMVILGTLGNLDKQAEARGNNIYKKYADLGVDIFATDRPIEVLETVNK